MLDLTEENGQSDLPQGMDDRPQVNPLQLGATKRTGWRVCISGLGLYERDASWKSIGVSRVRTGLDRVVKNEQNPQSIIDPRIPVVLG